MGGIADIGLGIAGIVSGLEGGSSHAQRAERDAKAGLSFENVFGGLNQALGLAPEFFGLLQGEGLKNTPLGQGYRLQKALLRTALGGLRGEAFPLPSDVASAGRESLAGQLGALGLDTSPAAAIAAADKFTGLGEQVRNSRINQALAILQGGGGAGSLFPDANTILGTNLSRAGALSGITLPFAQFTTQERRLKDEAFGRSVGQVFNGAQSLFGGLGGLGGGGIPGTTPGGGASSGTPIELQNLFNFGL